MMMDGNNLQFGLGDHAGFSGGCPFHRIDTAHAGKSPILTRGYKLVTEENADKLPVTCTSMMRFADDPISLMKELYQEHGNISAVQDDTIRIYFGFGPEYNQQLLSDPQTFNSSFFAIRGNRKSAQRRLTIGLLSMNGDQHKRHRRMVKEPFSKKTIATYRDGIAQLAEDLVNREWQAGMTVDINHDITHFMLRIVSGILFGMDIPDLAFETGGMIDKWVGYNHELGPLAFASHPELNSKYDELLAYGEVMEKKIRQIIEQRKSGKKGNDVLSLLIQAHDAEGGITDDELVGHVTLLFAAAHLTTAHTISWTSFLLSQHPQVMQRLDQEFQEILAGRTPQLEDLDKLTYLDCVIRESMRIMPASAYSQRMNTVPVEVGPFTVKPGSVMIFSQFMTHHLENLYEKADHFIPERWETLNPPPYAYIPFGGGPRLCVGGPLAMEVMKITLPTIFQKFRLSMKPGSEVNAKVISTMLNPSTPILIELNEQDRKFRTEPVGGNIHSLLTLPPESRSSEIRKAA